MDFNRDKYSAYFDLLARADIQRNQRFTKTRAKQLFNSIAGLKTELRMEERHDGCFQRTQLTQEIMERRGIKHGFMFGQFDGTTCVQHIAPYAQVKRLGRSIDMVFDFTFHTMAPIKEMKQLWLERGAYGDTIEVKSGFYRPAIDETLSFLENMYILPPWRAPDLPEDPKP